MQSWSCSLKWSLGRYLFDELCVNFGFLEAYCFFDGTFILLIFTITQDIRPVPPPEKTKDDIFLFFKLYDPLKEELR